MSNEKEMYSIAGAADALADSVTGLEEVMVSLAKSKTWGIISRMSSGIFSKFWAIQNKFRAITIMFQQYFEHNRKQTKEQLKAMAAATKLSKLYKINLLEFHNFDVDSMIGKVIFLAPERKKELNDAISRLGLKGSQVEINQIMSRIGDLDTSKDKTKIRDLILNATTFGVPALEKTKVGKKISNLAQKTYVATDDLGKMATFFRERKRTEKIT